MYEYVYVNIYHTHILPTFAQFVHPARASLLLSFCWFLKREIFVSTHLFDNLIFFVVIFVYFN